MTTTWYERYRGLVPSTGYPGATPDLSLTSRFLAQIQSKAVDSVTNAPVACKATGSDQT